MSKLSENQSGTNAFPHAEYQDRWSKARALMAANGLDALLVTEETNYIYLSGHTEVHFAFSSKTRPLAMILPLKQDPVLVVPLQRKSDAMVSAVSQVRTWNQLPYSSDSLLNVLKELGLENGRIGAELGREQRIAMPVGEFDRLRQQLSQAEFVDASNVFWQLRQVKSAGEIERIRISCDILGRAYQRCFDQIRVGMEERDIVTSLFMAMMIEGADRPGFIALRHYTPDVEGSPAPSNRQVQVGDMYRIDGGCLYKDYYCDFMRYFVVGKPSAGQKEAVQLSQMATNAAIEKIRPGVTGMELIAHVTATLAAKGYAIPPHKQQRIGHGLGLDFTEPPSVSTLDDTDVTYKAGMVLALEPGIFYKGHYVTTEQNVVVTESGSELLSTSPWDLYEV